MKHDRLVQPRCSSHDNSKYDNCDEDLGVIRGGENGRGMVYNARGVESAKVSPRLRRWRKHRQAGGRKAVLVETMMMITSFTVVGSISSSGQTTDEKSSEMECCKS